MSFLFDTHSHYNLSPLLENYQALQTDALDAQIQRAVVVGTDTQSSQTAVNLQEKMPDYFLASLGLHPEICQGDEATFQAEIEKWQQIDQSQFAAYGEIGLDFFHLDKTAPNFARLVARQTQLLTLQLEAALRQPKPVIFHVRDDFCDPDHDTNAYGLILKIIAHTHADNLTLIFHCFSGNTAYLEKVLALPQSYISFAGNLTFKSAANLRELSLCVPSQRLLLETDSPFLAPEGERGKACLPAMLAITAKFAEKNLNLNLDQIYQNSCQLFLSILS